MQKLGMKYCYSYEEHWQPKNFPVVFRMYQLNFNEDDTFVYKRSIGICIIIILFENL